MAGRGGKGGGSGGLAGAGMKSMLQTATKRVRDLDISDAAPPSKRARNSPPPAPPLPAATSRKDVGKVLTQDEQRKQWAKDARKDQRDAKANNPAGTKASGVTGGKKPQRLWATPGRERPDTVDVLRPDPRPGHDPNPKVPDKQTTYWAARWLPTSKNPKGLGGGNVPTSVPDQAAWVAYQRADRVLYPRQTFPADVRQQTWTDSAGSSNSFTDVGGRTVTRNGAWDMGHVPGHEHWSNVRDAFSSGTDPKDFKADYLNPANYRPEHPTTNRGHDFEAN